MKRFWCRLFADWLKRNYMDHTWRGYFHNGIIITIFVLLYCKVFIRLVRTDCHYSQVYPLKPRPFLYQNHSAETQTEPDKTHIPYTPTSEPADMKRLFRWGELETSFESCPVLCAITVINPRNIHVYLWRTFVITINKNLPFVPKGC